MHIEPMAAHHLPVVTALGKACDVYVPSAQDVGLLMLEREAICGFIAWHVILDEAELLSLAVDKDYRRRGIGKALLQASVMQWQASNVAHAFLEVREHNSPAQTLYAQCGFQLSGRRKRYYHHPKEDALMMRLDLDIASHEIARD